MIIIPDQDELNAINDVDLLRKHIVTLSMMVVKAKIEINELQDRERCRRDRIREMKKDVGADDSISFDVVWKELIDTYKGRA